MISSSLETIEATLMQLPHPDRVHLAERLLASLEEDDEISPIGWQNLSADSMLWSAAR